MQFGEAELKNLSARHRKVYSQLRDRYEGILCRIISRGVNAGVFAEVDEKLARYAIISMLARTGIWFSLGGRLTAGGVADFMVEFATRALRREQAKTLQG